eukprot:sb/3462088/
MLIKLEPLGDLSRFVQHATSPVIHESVIVQVGGGATISCSGTILASRSERLCRTLTRTYEIILGKSFLGKLAQVKEILSLLYGGEIHLTTDNISTCLRFGIQFGIQSLTDICVVWMSEKGFAREANSLEVERDVERQLDLLDNIDFQAFEDDDFIDLDALCASMENDVENHDNNKLEKPVQQPYNQIPSNGTFHPSPSPPPGFQARNGNLTHTNYSYQTPAAVVQPHYQLPQHTQPKHTQPQQSQPQQLQTYLQQGGLQQGNYTTQTSLPESRLGSELSSLATIPSQPSSVSTTVPAQPSSLATSIAPTQLSSIATIPTQQLSSLDTVNTQQYSWDSFVREHAKNQKNVENSGGWQVSGGGKPARKSPPTNPPPSHSPPLLPTPEPPLKTKYRPALAHWRDLTENEIRRFCSPDCSYPDFVKLEVAISWVNNWGKPNYMSQDFFRQITESLNPLEIGHKYLTLVEKCLGAQNKTLQLPGHFLSHLHSTAFVEDIPSMPARYFTHFWSLRNKQNYNGDLDEMRTTDMIHFFAKCPMINCTRGTQETIFRLVNKTPCYDLRTMEEDRKRGKKGGINYPVHFHQSSVVHWVILDCQNTKKPKLHFLTTSTYQEITRFLKEVDEGIKRALIPDYGHTLLCGNIQGVPYILSVGCRLMCSERKETTSRGELFCQSIGLTLFSVRAFLLVIIESECYDRLSEGQERFLDLLHTLEDRLGCCGCLDGTDYEKLKMSHTCPITDQGCLLKLYKEIDDRSVWAIVIGSTSSVTLLTIILTINCYLIKHYRQEPIKRTSLARSNKVTPSPSLSSTQMSHWVSNMNTIQDGKVFHREDSF